METNGNGYMKAIVVGVAVLVLGAVVVGAGGGTIKNTIINTAQQVEINQHKEDMAEQKADIAKIPVMDERIKDIKEDVGKILEKLNK
jgi:ABC-type lipoprotein release transport system permease subunit